MDIPKGNVPRVAFGPFVKKAHQLAGSVLRSDANRDCLVSIGFDYRNGYLCWAKCNNIKSRLEDNLRSASLRPAFNDENPGRRAAMTEVLRTEGLIFQNAHPPYQQTLEQKSPGSWVLLPS